MNILIIGDKKKADELQHIIPAHVSFQYSQEPPENLHDGDLIVDLNFDTDSKNLKRYALLTHKPVIVSAVKKQLARAAHDFQKNINCHLIGMNLMPGLINRKLVELSLLHEHSSQAVEQIAVKLDWNVRIVEDRVGMVTPRVVCMIINEACYVLQEGAASIRDIDTAMKLGTNYPYGPFEWAEKIGIKEIYETLLAIYEDTREERYKICPLLQTKYLKGENFYDVR
jgi:3-hydroxybutyryl-CoA dehydrogenase